MTVSVLFLLTSQFYITFLTVRSIYPKIYGLKRCNVVRVLQSAALSRGCVYVQMLVLSETLVLDLGHVFVKCRNYIPYMTHTHAHIRNYITIQ